MEVLDKFKRIHENFRLYLTVKEGRWANQYSDKIVIASKVNVRQKTRLQIENRGPSDLVLKGLLLYPSSESLTICDASKNWKELLIREGKKITIVMHTLNEEPGIKRFMLLFSFSTKNTKGLKYSHQEIEIIFHYGVFKLPAKSNQHRCEVSLPKYEFLVTVSGKVKNCVNPFKCDISDEIREYCLANAIQRSNKNFAKLRKLFDEGPSIEKYFEYFSLLLSLEEFESEREYLQYTLHGITMYRNKRVMKLTIPDKILCDKLRLRKGDLLYIKVTSRGHVTSYLYEGQVINNFYGKISVKLSLRFYDETKSLTAVKCDVYFKASSFVFDIIKMALHAVSARLPSSLLFCEDSGQNQSHLTNSALKLEFYNESVSRNPEQASAVHQIVQRSSHPYPYLLLGPPGTGKTTTVVEAILQIVKTNTDCNVLCCAQSNKACDAIAQKLLEQKCDCFQRLYSNSINKSDIPPELEDNATFGHMLKGKCSTRVVVCTNVSSRQLIFSGWPVTYLFLDEAAQSSEAESIVPIQTIYLNIKHCFLVLSGDPFQLGPVLKSPLISDQNATLMERLLQYSHYSNNGGYNSKFITKLVRNFRSHPELLTVPNKLFYEDELEAHAPLPIVTKLSDWNELPVQKFPLFVHGVVGLEQRQTDSYSLYNCFEIDIVLSYVAVLLKSVEPKNIGVISPYAIQVEKIKSRLPHEGMNITVGTPESFQGSEREVIIISTVRSSEDLFHRDAGKHVGFLRNPKRFNVAVTRAKCLLVVVGNPFVLSTDKNWSALLQHCLRNGSYKGTELPSSLISKANGRPKTPSETDVAVLLEKLVLNDC